MNALVVYDSKFGNTEQLALAIAEALGAPAVRATDELPLLGVELLVVGAPTQQHHVAPPMRQVLDALPEHALDGMAAAAFDTRFRRNPLLTGSAARGIARRLERRGARLVAGPESFFVADTEGPLEEGELARATDWARSLAAVPA